jgi:hypothetical protein
MPDQSDAGRVLPARMVYNRLWRTPARSVDCAATAFMVCRAISIAMTVLPAPVEDRDRPSAELIREHMRQLRKVLAGSRYQIALSNLARETIFKNRNFCVNSSDLLMADRE